MFSQNVFRIIVFSLLCIGLAECLGSAAKNSSSGKSNVKTYKADNTKEMEFRQNLNGALIDPAQPKAQKLKDVPPKNSRSFGLSAWALIGLILSVILCGIFMYYATIFYPILCKKERKYDVMEVSATP